jgi:hypothetical protein
MRGVAGFDHGSHDVFAPCHMSLRFPVLVRDQTGCSHLCENEDANIVTPKSNSTENGKPFMSHYHIDFSEIFGLSELRINEKRKNSMQRNKN